MVSWAHVAQCSPANAYDARKLGIAGVTRAIPFTMTASTPMLIASDTCSRHDTVLQE